MKNEHTLARLPEQALLDHLGELVRCDRRTTARLLTAIAEIDQRKLWAKHGCPSMFAFCMQRFHMSESMTAKRINAARKARSFPLILAMVARGELHLSGINQLGKHLTEANHEAVLLQAKHKSSREIELLVARIAPRPDVPARIRALPRRVERSECVASPADAPQTILPCESGVSPRTRSAEMPEASNEPGVATSVHALSGRDERTASEAMSGASNVSAVLNRSVVSDDSDQRSMSSPSVGSQVRPARRALHRQISPLAPQRYKLEITVGQDTHDKLRSLQDLLAHQVPNGDLEMIVARAIELLLDETLKKKAALTDNPRRETGTARPTPRRTRTIPAPLRRQVWQRDSGCCTFVDEHGHRCPATRGIEYHHEVPYARGGRHEFANVSLRCRAHNQYQADLDFGEDFMNGKRTASYQHSVRHVSPS